MCHVVVTCQGVKALEAPIDMRREGTGSSEAGKVKCEQGEAGRSNGCESVPAQRNPAAPTLQKWVVFLVFGLAGWPAFENSCLFRKGGGGKEVTSV